MTKATKPLHAAVHVGFLRSWDQCPQVTQVSLPSANTVERIIQQLEIFNYRINFVKANSLWLQVCLDRGEDKVHSDSFIISNVFLHMWIYNWELSSK